MPLFTSHGTRSALTNLIEDIDKVIEEDGDYLFGEFFKICLLFLSILMNIPHLKYT